MTANVALTDTFDQWRVKTNEVVVMTQADGMNNIIKTLDTTNSTSNTTGSIITAGGVGIKKSVYIGENLTVQGNVVVDGDTTISGNLTFGDAATDQVTFTADINSNIIPNASSIPPYTAQISTRPAGWLASRFIVNPHFSGSNKNKIPKTRKIKLFKPRRVFRIIF